MRSQSKATGTSLCLREVGARIDGVVLGVEKAGVEVGGEGGGEVVGIEIRVRTGVGVDIYVGIVIDVSGVVGIEVGVGVGVGVGIGVGISVGIDISVGVDVDIGVGTVGIKHEMKAGPSRGVEIVVEPAEPLVGGIDWVHGRVQSRGGIQPGGLVHARIRYVNTRLRVEA